MTWPASVTIPLITARATCSAVTVTVREGRAPVCVVSSPTMPGQITDRPIPEP
jgi:hypothetical protein